MEEPRLELSGYFAVARRWWWTLLVAAWVAGLAGFYVASRIQPTYESQVKLLVGPINTDAETLRASGQLVQTYAQLVMTGSVLDVTLQELGLTDEMSPAQLAENTRVIANDVTRVLAIRVQDTEFERAADLANQMADQMILISKSGVNRPEGALSYLQEADPNPDPVAPQISLIVLLATLAGIIAAIVLVLLIEYLSRSIRTREELAALAGAPVLGSVPAPARGNPDPRDLVGDSSSAATVYRVIAGRIVYGDPEEVIHSLAVVDTESETGSAVVAINLGRALARLGRRVVVIDGGIRGSLAGLYGVEPVPGIRDVLAREVQPRSAMRIIGERLALIPAGFEGSDLVDPERARAVVHELLASADVVIVAAPPVDVGPGALSWGRALDRTVLVARRDHARREDVEAAAETLVQVGGNLIGTILAERPAPLAGLFGRGRSGSSRVVIVPPRASPMATPKSTVATAPPAAASAPSAATYRPGPPSSTPTLIPSSVRPTIIRASAPATPVSPEPPSPVDPPTVDRPSRSTGSRAASTRARSSRSAAPRIDPNDTP
jgi:capsular polysaccharide biosynthesis protein/MinD-like ATPase involved in chromosome partitioning or flagellar assembly